jgi:hypothetical protein
MSLHVHYAVCLEACLANDMLYLLHTFTVLDVSKNYKV